MPATLSATLRDGRGKNAARALRRTGRIPAVVYGHGEETRALSVDSLELEKLLSSISVENTIIDLDIEGIGSSQALIREVQQHPFKPLIYHIDLYQMHAGETVRLQIPIRLHGNPYGVRESSGVLDHSLYDLEVECLPHDIPESVDVDVTNLDIGDVIRVADLEVPNVEILNDPDVTVCSVTAPTVMALPEEEEEAEGVGEMEEPELIRRRPEEDEEPPAENQG